MYAKTVQKKETEMLATENSTSKLINGAYISTFLWLLNSCLSRYVLKMVLQTWLTSIPTIMNIQNHKGSSLACILSGTKKHTAQHTHTGSPSSKRSMFLEKSHTLRIATNTDLKKDFVLLLTDKDQPLHSLKGNLFLLLLGSG